MDTRVAPAALQAIAHVLQQRLDVVAHGTVRQYAGRFIIDATTEGSREGLALSLGPTGRLEFRFTDGQGRFAAALPQIDRALRRAGVSVPTAAPTGLSQVFEIDDGKPAGPLSAILTSGASGAYHVLDAEVPHAESLLARAEARRAMPAGVVLSWSTSVTEQGSDRYRTFYALQNSVVLDNAAVKRAVARADPGSGTIVAIEFTPAGSAALCEATRRHVNEFLAIVVDGRVQGEPPIIRDRICGGAAQIELGDKPLAEAQYLALYIRTEPLPVPIRLVEEGVPWESGAQRR